MSLRIMEQFFSLPLKAVVGASTDRMKFGNKVLRCYIDKKQLAVPINKRQATIEGIMKCLLKSVGCHVCV
jgi:hypothetical protein